jgi:IclR family mhp operon transcriptional activator
MVNSIQLEIPMLDYKVKTIRALERGLQVLEYLYSQGGATLAEMHEATGLPRATLMRILMTLKESELVWQRMADGAFLPGYHLERIVVKPDVAKRLSEISAPFLLELCDKTMWPSVVAVPGTGCMEVVETNVSEAYFDEIRLGPVGYKINYLRAASGRAFLAFCSEQERESILEILRRNNRPSHVMAHDHKAINKMVKESQQLGYALRVPDFGGDYDKPKSEIDDGRHSMAVPIRVARIGTIGSLNITWKNNVVGLEDGIQRYLKDLKKAAKKIGTAYSKATPITSRT